jgi:hypothetical protein
LTEATKEDILTLEKMSIAFSVFDNDKCVACGGFILWHEDEAEAWFKLSKQIIERPMAIVRAIMEAFRIELRLFDGDIFCWVEDDWPVAQRFAQWSGFTKTDRYKMLDNKRCFLWELKLDSTNGSRASSIRGRGHPTRKPRTATDGAASPNTRV